MRFYEGKLSGYIASTISVLLVAVALSPFSNRIGGETPTTLLLVTVLLVASKWGMGPAMVSSLLGVLYLNFFFYSPPGLKFQLSLAEDEELLALTAFLVTSIIVGELSSRAQRRHREVQQLYDQLRVAFDRASELEAVKRSEQFKSALLDTVTHDLRTPLTTIKAAASTLLETESNNSPEYTTISAPAQKEMLDLIVQQADRLNRFIEGMLDMAKLQSGMLTRSDSPEGIEDTITVALARAQDRLAGRRVEVDCAEDLPAVPINGQAIAQALFSVLENAAQYSPPGSTIRISTEADEAHVRIAVEDEGPGIPEAYREKVFEKFFRLPASRTEREGTGLGLAIARGIAEAHHGRIWIEDRPHGERGTRIVLSLPTTNSIQRAGNGLPSGREISD